MNTNPTALLAEDEPLLAQALLGELALAWPQLNILDTVGDGASALRRAMELQPDVLFFDIRMPGMSGLDAAVALLDEWDTSARPFPALVFVTAYDEYAVQAFEAQAVDYLLKPVQAVRLAKTVTKVQAALAQRSTEPGADTGLEQTLAQLRGLLRAGPVALPCPGLLQVIQASVTTAAGTRIHMVPVADIVYFEAADKYLRVLTREQEYLIRLPLRELLPQLDPQVFWQIHRGAVVRAGDIESVLRDEAGKLTLSLRSRSDKLAVSRLYAHLFKAM